MPPKKGFKPHNFIDYQEGQVLGDQCIFIRDTDIHIKPRKALFRCRCGNEFEANVNSIRTLHTKSCGCYKENFNVNKFTTHNKTLTDEYRIWQGIKKRIFDETSINFKHYGGRNIKMHESWVNDFPQFLKDTGLRPSKKHSIDRIDVNGNYEPGNVKYSTQKEQCNNKRNNVYIEYKGEIKTIAQWSDVTGLKQELLRKRIREGWDLEDAFNPKKRVNQFG